MQGVQRAACAGFIIWLWQAATLSNIAHRTTLGNERIGKV
jgi:hypothetical protein